MSTKKSESGLATDTEVVRRYLEDPMNAFAIALATTISAHARILGEPATVTVLTRFLRAYIQRIVTEDHIPEVLASISEFLVTGVIPKRNRSDEDEDDDLVDPSVYN